MNYSSLINSFIPWATKLWKSAHRKDDDGENLSQIALFRPLFALQTTGRPLYFALQITARTLLFE